MNCMLALAAKLILQASVCRFIRYRDRFNAKGGLRRTMSVPALPPSLKLRLPRRLPPCLRGGRKYLQQLLQGAVCQSAGGWGK